MSTHASPSALFAEKSSLPCHNERESAEITKVKCQVCGENLYEPIVWCKKCFTPHHKDCWYYNRWCSIYGCGCRFYTHTDPSDPSAVSHSCTTNEPDKIHERNHPKEQLKETSENKETQLHMSKAVKAADVLVSPIQAVSIICWMVAEFFTLIFQNEKTDRFIVEKLFPSSVKGSALTKTTYAMYVATWQVVIAKILILSAFFAAAAYVIPILMVAFVYWYGKRHFIGKRLKKKNTRPLPAPDQT